MLFCFPILSDPGKLLFVLKDVDNAETDLTVDHEPALCGGSRKQVLLLLLLSYLLKRKMVLGSSSLVPSRPEHEAARRAFTKENNDSVTLKFPSEKRRKYFTLFFKDSWKALTALRLVQEKDTFVDLCHVSSLCWVTCMALSWQMETGDDGKFSCQMLTDLYAHFLANTLAWKAAVSTCRCRRVLLECQCWLALEGLSL